MLGKVRTTLPQLSGSAVSAIAVGTAAVKRTRRWPQICSPDHAKSIDLGDAGRQIVPLITDQTAVPLELQLENFEEVRKAVDALDKILVMHSMSKSKMHLRAAQKKAQIVSDLINALKAGVSEKKSREEKLRVKRQTMKKRRETLHRASRTNLQSKHVCQDLEEHLSDLESEGAISNEMKRRGIDLIQEGDWLTMLQFTKFDDKLHTYLRFKRSKREITAAHKMKMKAMSDSLDAEIAERSEIIRCLQAADEVAEVEHGDSDCGTSILKSQEDALQPDGVRALESQHVSTSDSDLKPFGREVAYMVSKEMETRIQSIFRRVVRENKEYENSISSVDDVENSDELRTAAIALENTKKAGTSDSAKLLSAAIKSFVRIRPDSDDDSCLVRLGDNMIALNRMGFGEGQKKLNFSVDHVFDEACTQVDVFEAVKPVVLNTLAGFNASIFAYGTTGSGKTHTIVGDANSSSSAGIIPRSIEAIFTEAGRLGVEDKLVFSISACYLEVYRDQIINLSAKSSVSYDHLAARNNPAPGVDIYVDKQGRSTFRSESQVWIPCESFDDVMAVHNRGCAVRATGRTNLNLHSSRSHSILMIRVATSGPNGSWVGTLSVVDLAGSENVKQSGVLGQGLGEAKSNNKSLSALGNVLSVLAQNSALAKRQVGSSSKLKRKGMFVPYRSSKLTLLLKDTLGGNSNAVMITAVRKKECFSAQTAMSLMYAERATSIENSVKKNVQSTADVVEQAKKDAEYRKLLARRVQSSIEVGDYMGAIGSQRILLSATQQTFGLLSLQAAAQTFTLAALLSNVAGNEEEWNEVVTLHARALGVRVVRYKEYHPLTLQSMSSLATAIDVTVHNGTAVPWSVEDAESIHIHCLCATDSPATSGLATVTLRYEVALANHYKLRGDYEAAIKRLELVVVSACRVHGEDHVEVARAMHQVSEALRSAKMYIRAAEKERQVLQMYERLLGLQSPEAIVSCQHIVQILYDAKEWGGAERTQEQLIVKLIAWYSGNAEGPAVSKAIAGLLDIRAKSGKISENDLGMLEKILSSLGNRAALNQLGVKVKYEA